MPARRTSPLPDNQSGSRASVSHARQIPAAIVALQTTTRRREFTEFSHGEHLPER